MLFYKTSLKVPALSSARGCTPNTGLRGHPNCSLTFKHTGLLNTLIWKAKYSAVNWKCFLTSTNSTCKSLLNSLVLLWHLAHFSTVYPFKDYLISIHEPLLFCDVQDFNGHIEFRPWLVGDAAIIIAHHSPFAARHLRKGTQAQCGNTKTTPAPKAPSNITYQCTHIKIVSIYSKCKTTLKNVGYFLVDASICYVEHDSADLCRNDVVLWYCS